MSTFRCLCLFLLSTNAVLYVLGLPDDELIAVAVIYRHGDRTPIEPYPNDPYRNRSYWTVDFGQLTNIGKQQHYHFGTWLRQRYNTFLPSDYSECDIYVRSTDIDRTLMSAEANLAGLYPPMAHQRWNSALLWQPIPIHTVPDHLDPILAMKKPCERFQQLHNDLLVHNTYFTDLIRTNHDLLAYLTRNSGKPINSLEAVDFLYSDLYIEHTHNFTLPNWTRDVYPEKLRPLAAISFTVPCYTREMARLTTGPFFHHLLEKFRHHTLVNSTTTNKCHPKFFAFSAHDTTIANLLQSLGLFEPAHCPAYTSTIIFELKRQRHPPSTYYVNMYYRRNTSGIVEPLQLPTCDFHCDFEQFVTHLAPITISTSDWDVECRITKNNTWYQWSWNDLIVIGTVLIMVLIVFTLTLCIIVYCKKRHQQTVIHKLPYTRLPNDDEVI